MNQRLAYCLFKVPSASGIHALLQARAMENQKRKNSDLALPGEMPLIKRSDIKSAIVFNETNPIQEPLLNIADYLCWTIQRIFEKGETRYYDHVKEKISQVIDIYDQEKYKDYQNYYSPKHPLTAGNKISPPLH